jgi:hypothetical protein
MMPRYALLLTLLLNLAAASAVLAQESIIYPEPHRDARRSLRAARRYPAADDVRKSHLAVDKRDLRAGEGGRRQRRNPNDGRDRYKFDNTGTPRVSDPNQRIGLGLSRKKKTKSEE